MNTDAVRQLGRWGRITIALAVAMGWAAGASSDAQELQSVEREWGAFALHPSFRIDLVASEPTIVAPDAIGWDARERMWCLVGAERIVILPRSPEETATVFASDLRGATSFVFHRDGLLVADADGVAWLRDTDGDDRMDARVRTLRLSGRIGRMQWGCDGWIYAAFAAHEQDSPEGETDRFADVPSGLVRLRADGSAFEGVVALADELRGFDITSDGEIFLASDATHVAHLVLPDSAFSSGRVGAVSSWIDSTDHTFIERAPGATLFGQPFTTPGGSCVYEGGAWPAPFSGNHFSSEPRGGLIHRDLITPWGVAFRANHIGGAEFLTSKDPNFRPTALAVGPDGALYVLDRYADDPAAGRIWRVQHTDVGDARATQSFDAADASELMKRLASPNRRRRMMAHRLLLEHGLDAEQRRALANMALESDNAWLDLHAVWLASESVELMRSCLSNYDAGVRKNALAVLRTSEPLARRLPTADIRARARDGAPRTELEALRAWSVRVDGPSHLELVELYPKLENDWSRSAALAIAGKRPATTLSVILKRGAERDFYDLVRLLARDVGRRGSLRDAVSMVLTLREGNAPPRLVSIVLRTLYKELDESEKPWSSPRLSITLRRLSSDDDLTIASAALPLARRWLGDQLATHEVTDWSTRLREVAEDPERGLETRLDVLDALLEIPEAQVRALALAERFLTRTYPAATQSRVTASVGSLSVIEAAHSLARGFAQLTGEAQEIAFERLFAKPAWTTVLLDAVDAGHITSADLGPERIARLRAHPDSALAERASHL